jgi:hypothetical protein
MELEEKSAECDALREARAAVIAAAEQDRRALLEAAQALMTGPSDLSRW